MAQMEVALVQEVIVCKLYVISILRAYEADVVATAGTASRAAATTILSAIMEVFLS